MTKPLCIYHGNCADGFGAAWVVRKAFGESGVEFFAGKYGDAPPDVSNRVVYVVDFSYPREVLQKMAESALHVIVLDHHKTAKDQLEGLADVETVFDMERSGARITWDFFFPDIDPPALILHIEDRDLWRFGLAGTREIQSCVFSYPYDFKVWDELMASSMQALRKDGEAIERKHQKDVAELVGVTKRRMVIGGHDVPVANLPYTLVSDAAGSLAVGEPFAACYWDTETHRIFGLRSAPEGVDVALIAQQYGGGGHAHSAGFRVPYGHPLQQS